MSMDLNKATEEDGGQEKKEEEEREIEAKEKEKHSFCSASAPCSPLRQLDDNLRRRANCTHAGGK